MVGTGGGGGGRGIYGFGDFEKDGGVREWWRVGCGDGGREGGGGREGRRTVGWDSKGGVEERE